VTESRRLRERGAAQWAAAINHPMVAAIGDGTLPHETFRFYFEQNLQYLHEYARAIALTAGNVPDPASLAVLTRFLAQIVEVEIPANRRFLERLGGTADGGLPRLLPTSYAYTRHILDAARGGTAVALAALLPCQWSYGEIGRRLARSAPEDPVYADWIALFAGDGYDDLVIASTELLDRLTGEGDRSVATDAFDRSTRYEIAFWEMAWTRGASDR
jgi:thiaminase/transcriptional activator TenA